ncbi:MAG: heme ABC exporter ATP-binding protein CcmA [Erythrobacter sp.]
MQGAGITTTDLACRRGDRLLFRGLSLNVGAGEALHITGANGIGKSSLLRILAGLLSPFAGDVESKGAIALLDERPALDLDAPLGKALGFWESVDGCIDPSTALEVLELEPLLDVPVRYLSTGQRKRAAMASILNRGAPIWLLDEPLSGLDTAAQAKLASLIQLHVGCGGVCVLASHQPVAVDGLKSLELAEFTP